MQLKNSTDFSDHFLRRLAMFCCRELGVPTTARSRVRPRLLEIQFTKYRRQYRGRAWSGGRVLVRIGGEGITYNRYRYKLNGEPIESIFVLLRSVGLDVRQSVKTLNKDGTLEIEAGRVVQCVCESTYEPFYPLTGKYPGRVHAPTFMLADRIEALVHVTAHEVAHLARWQYTNRNREAHVDGMAIALTAKFREQREQLLAEWSQEPTPRVAKPKPSRAERNECKVRDKLATWQKKLVLAKTKVRKYSASVRRYDRIAAKKDGLQNG